jgi:hypothetical protein
MVRDLLMVLAKDSGTGLWRQSTPADEKPPEQSISI